MICPVCHFDNIAGSDDCENCGADLRSTGLPTSAGGDVGAALLTEHLAELNPRQPVAVKPDDDVAAAVRLMQEHRIGCVVVDFGPPGRHPDRAGCRAQAGWQAARGRTCPGRHDA